MTESLANRTIDLLGADNWHDECTTLGVLLQYMIGQRDDSSPQAMESLRVLVLATEGPFMCDYCTVYLNV
jgi:hypothetical protein